MKPSGLRWVIGEAEVTKVDERQIEFTVRATEGAKEVGAGSHSRVVIDVANSSGGSAEQCFEDGGLPGHGLWLSLDGENRYL
jgi:predicted thioesterase